MVIETCCICMLYVYNTQCLGYNEFFWLLFGVKDKTFQIKKSMNDLWRLFLVKHVFVEYR